MLNLFLNFTYLYFANASIDVWN